MCLTIKINPKYIETLRFPLLLIIVSFILFLVIALKASAWSVDNPAHIEEYIHYVASAEGIPVGEALAIARCESRLNKDAVNSKGELSVGVFQINLKYHPLTMEEAKNPFININYAMDLYWQKDKNGEYLRWKPWQNCSKMLTA